MRGGRRERLSPSVAETLSEHGSMTMRQYAQFVGVSAETAKARMSSANNVHREIYISDWVTFERSNGREQLCALYSAGTKPDAPRPNLGRVADLPPQRANSVFALGAMYLED